MRELSNFNSDTAVIFSNVPLQTKLYVNSFHLIKYTIPSAKFLAQESFQVVKNYRLGESKFE